MEGSSKNKEGKSKQMWDMTRTSALACSLISFVLRLAAEKPVDDGEKKNKREHIGKKKKKSWDQRMHGCLL